ncbi:alcohol dehydrogenase catalytic domain-containing protein [Bacillus sp. B15-48]|uniref:zinc-binding dehydrogenase n=1 Tax=Bacillus sp. B15-48 TaxID=1548601 RepID=UPI00193F782F|nr:alcohol dehydrogenase catalytic domain-containing protein [Bacillus sp. B15-48]MBM4765012.1 alcohol dehydrogenase catalytic domain-containing protein [Bacillus sp. B15-48]
MKALVIEDVKTMGVKEISDPTIDENGILVNVKANGVCRSDWHVWAGDHPISQPVMGHEFSGVVAEVGKNVKNFKKGDRVIVPFSGSDGTCPHCQKGNTHLCDSFFVPGLAYTGGYAEYVGVPIGDRNVIHLPEEISFTDGAALGCRFMTAFEGIIGKIKVQPGEWVAVYGCGGVGLSAINIATAVGANVIAVDINENNLNLAKRMGAVYTINSRETAPVEAIKELTKGGADVSIDALGIAETCVNAINSLRKKGRHLQIGVTTKQEAGFISLPIDHMVVNEIKFETTLGMPAHRFNHMLPLVANGRLNPGKMVTREISLSEVNRIFEDMSNFATTGTFVVTEFA